MTYLHSFQAIVIGTVLSALTATSVSAQCEPPNGNDQVPDTTQIQCLLDQGGTIVLNADVQYGYYIGPPGLVLRQSGTTLTSTSAFGYRALLIATSNLNVPMLQVESSAVSGYTISNIWFYGDRWNRVNPNCSGDQSVNLWLRGSWWLLDNIESDTVPCNTSTLVEGPTTSNFEIRNSWFANNGWSETERANSWADGLTLGACVDGYVHHNNFRDNTDIDLVSGGSGGSGCWIEDNVIQHTLSYGFAGIHLGWFPGPGDGNHAGSTFARNSISSGFDKLGFGIIVGYHPWGSTRDNPDVGRTVTNTATGAVINLAVEASNVFVVGEVTGNTVGGAQGSNGLGTCPISSNYTVYQPHATGITLQPGWFDLRFDDHACFPQ